MTAKPPYSKESSEDTSLQTELPRVVCLGASAGGLEALKAFFEAIPENPGIPFVVVVHLSPHFKSLMPELLSKHTSMPVQAAADDTVVEPNHVYIIPPGKNMVLAGGTLELQPQDRAPGHALNLPIDFFLSSLAENYAERSIAIILSGTGSDGSRGIRSVKEAGGVVFVQNPEDAKFDGMPMSALQTGLVDHRGIPEELAERVVRLIGRPLPAFPALSTEYVAEHDGEDDEETEVINRCLEKIISLIRAETKLDISYFRPKMIARRVQRRMAIEGAETVEDYIARLENDPGEVRYLGEDMLIGVTNFFRDPKAYDSLRDNALQELLLNVPPEEQVRVWVTACSTGDEAYSIAMMLMEAMRASGVERKIKVFATDVDQRALERATRGSYSLSEASDIPVHLLSRYFEQNVTEYVARPVLREKIIFAQHNLVTDPPFNKMHLVTCRNLLIYLKPEAQLQVLNNLFLALRPKEGILFLGSAETPKPIENGLSCIDSKAKIYRRTGNIPRFLQVGRHIGEPLSVITAPPRPIRPDSAARAEADMLRHVLNAHFESKTQSAAVINQDSHLIEILSDNLNVFHLPPGKPTNDLTKMLSSGLVIAITSGLQKLKGDQNSASYISPRAVDHPDNEHDIVVHLHRIYGPKHGRRSLEHSSVLLVLSTREQPADVVSQVDYESVETVAALELELRQTKESLQAAIEELQSSNEELQSVNEELVASNEELQSTNEELQSVNEELYTVNAEYHTKNQELQVLTADLNTLLDSMNVATLFLDRDLCIRKFSSSISRIIPLQSVDHGRHIGDLAHHLDNDFVGDAETVLKSEEAIECEVRDKNGAWILMRLSRYEIADEHEYGVLATFVDVTRIKNAEEVARVMSTQLTQSNATLASQAEQLEDLFSIMAHDLKRPVLSLDGILKIAKDYVESKNPKSALKHLDNAIDSAETLRTMIRDLSDMAQLNHFEPELSWADLQSWLDELVAPFAEQAEEKGIRLNWVCDHGEFKFAQTAVGGIINNLVENALIHGTTAQNPRIDIMCQVEDEQMRVSVIDNGEGIAPQHHERVFELFRRLNPDKTEGSGVGLVAARRFAQRAKGSLRLESQPGHGAKFIAEIPVERRWVPIQEPILLVEDDALDAKHITKVLEPHPVQVVGTLKDASTALAAEPFSAILLDLSLPDGHGLELTTKVDAMNKNTPIIVLSSQLKGIPAETVESSLVYQSIDKQLIDSAAFMDVVKAAIHHRAQQL